MLRSIKVVLMLFAILALFSCRSKDYKIFHNGLILTMDGSYLSQENQALVIHDERILEITEYGKIDKGIIEKSEIIDLEGNLIMPGIIESHGHLFGAAMAKLGGVLPKRLDKAETLEWLKQEAENQKKKDWIIAGGWDQSNWGMAGFPSAKDIDEVIPDKPVFFTRVGGHAAWLNSAALKEAGINDETADPDGGIIIRDSSGKATGILIDNAISLVAETAISAYGLNPLKMATMAQETAFENGITTFNDMAMPTAILPVAKLLYRFGILKLNIRMHIASDEKTIDYISNNKPRSYFDGRFDVSSIKIMADGAMGSYGALLSEPYTDNPATTGVQVSSDEQMYALAEAAKDNGYQVATHSIGDLANKKIIDVYQDVIGNDSEGLYRWKIEHAQFLRPEDIRRIGEKKYIASMQPLMATSDMKWVESRLGPDRSKTTYTWRSLLDSGALIIGGSDVPVETINPFWGIYTAITRQNEVREPEGGFNAGEAITREEALQMYTTWAAYAAFREEQIGRLKENYYADLIIVDRDISRIPVYEILDTSVLSTYVRGELVYNHDL